MNTIVRRPVVRRMPLGFGHDLADFLDAGQDRAERDEPRLGRVGDDAGQRGLAGAGRPPQDDRLQQVALDRLAERLAGREELFLADELVEGARPHPLGQRRRTPAARGNGFFGKQRVHHIVNLITARQFSRDASRKTARARP